MPSGPISVNVEDSFQQNRYKPLEAFINEAEALDLIEELSNFFNQFGDERFIMVTDGCVVCKKEYTSFPCGVEEYGLESLGVFRKPSFTYHRITAHI